MSDRFANKTVVVTGAGSGIGAAAAKHFVAEGANVVLVGRTRDKLEDLLGVIADKNKVMIHAADVSDPAAVDALMQAVVDQFGGLDVLVNNAGVADGGPIAEVDDEAWRKVMSINVDGVFYCTRAAMPHLKERGGCIVNTSSVSGLGGDWNFATYNTSKGAVSNFTRAVALDYRDTGVRVNAICPSFTRSDMTEDMFDNEALMAKFAERMPMGRAAEAEEVADVIVFLASEDARFVNGVNLPVDGGLSASNGQPALG
ncbi:SDR family oxidoreductase [uncultured Salinisphaera sp.]|mgnify:CR=1 FL=1|uniref:SDR family NAD(P)-dependent oxidoreductase n=1 Tax=uncultured Salinisphaera sp. TaxID=359372 RepID=UPI0032B1F339|tara:strand:- start:614 stop:1384 length:771 start_codon:yes stop_codon:yes gene_type:complete